MITLGKKKTLHARRTALATLQHNEDAVKRLFDEVAPRAATRAGGYTRIVKLGMRKSDAAPMAFIEWVDGAGAEVEVATPTPAKKTRAKAAPGTESAAPAEGEAEAKPARKPRAKKAAAEEQPPAE
jgi:large subunit ribosomal protein L17